jgi:benzoate 4-monooxygenase
MANFSLFSIFRAQSFPFLLYATALLMAYLLAHSFYQFYAHALYPIPGPFWAKLTSFWLTYQCRRLNRSKAVDALHKKYGKFVRIAPNHVSISDPDALMQVYGHKSGFTKGPFYDAFMQVSPVVFTARDVYAHQRKRKYLNPAFANRGLADFESHMDVEIGNWIGQIDKMGCAAQPIDFCIWSKYGHFMTAWPDHFSSQLPRL